jgi:hypothetical protein
MVVFMSERTNHIVALLFLLEKSTLFIQMIVNQSHVLLI